MKKLLIGTMMLILAMGLLIARTTDEKQKAREFLRNMGVVPRPAQGNGFRSVTLSEYEEQSFTEDWESERKVLLSYNDDMTISSLLTSNWNYWEENWSDFERETVTYGPNGKVQQIVREQWDGMQWHPTVEVNFGWDSDRLMTVQHQLINDGGRETMMYQVYTYNPDNNRLEYVTTSINMWKGSREELLTRVYLEWDIQGRVESSTLHWGDGEDWIAAFKTEVTYQPEDQSNYQTFYEFLTTQITFGNHELNHIASQIKILQELEYYMDVDFNEWFLEGKYEYMYDTNMRLNQSAYYIYMGEWYLSEQVDYIYDANGNMIEWLVSDVMFNSVQPSFRRIYTFTQMSSNPENIATPFFTGLSLYPNPFNPQTTIAFGMEKAGNVEIAIFNIKGQKVRNLASNMKSSGKHQITWNGTDDNGRALSSGLYFVTLKSDREQLSRKLILQK